MFLTLLFEQPALYVSVVLAVTGSIVLHELGHAIAATWEGDPTPRIRGHFTWNPVVHMGWLAIGLLLVFGIAFGQTPVTPARFRHRRWGEAIVYFAGPFVNLLIACVGAVVVVLLGRFGLVDMDADGGIGWAARFWALTLSLNVLLFCLNLIPLPPLDGFGILESTFDLGELGPMLRRLHPYPLLAVFLLSGSDVFRSLTGGVTSGLIRAVSRALPL
jgi:Zn-dependent protease